MKHGGDAMFGLQVSPAQCTIKWCWNKRRQAEVEPDARHLEVP
jgi:hypothetical protein